ncbi:16S rRNA (adenine(1518)-N(6)/adenine(1519)-N(6))-dimethyltransferase RsmA [Psychrobacter pygoscelis]|uniref:16S rRNA (adenine(1518)-N(6)/adenine(1519)-N(6))- dimethyltransferase RsmA n=1 Tax=Psychrobacter pygoscelis TaxID=2488563 RepID=UPI00103F5061|nr:16S rRNA (adenine(1518)-N(6)/adenine(1519)-N(6))-dimethyltransferase RsmA [Psychrobacter pygoscelis]
MTTHSATIRAGLKGQHQPRKRFGQNFLHDSNIIRQIVESVRLQRSDNLVEIGPGMGALTEPLLAEVDAMTVIELDRDLADSLRIRIGANSHDNFNIIQANAMNVDYHDIYEQVTDLKATGVAQSPASKLRIVGNLPYNISTPLLFHLLEFADVIQDMHFMLQKEVVERITAEVGSKTYGRLSVIMQYYCDTDYLLTVPKGAFNPPPKVTSAVFRLTPHVTKPVQANDEKQFAVIVRESFNHRRKTMRAIFKKSTLLPTLSDDDFAAVDIDPQARPETIDVTQFVALSNHIAALSY